LTVGNTTGQANSVFSLSQPGEAIDIPDIVSFETFPNLAAQFPTANLSLDVSSVNSSGQVTGEIASFVSPAVFDPATGVTENRSPFFLENNFPAGGFVEDISEDGNLLVGRGLNIQQFSNTGIPLFRATYIEGDEIVFISENESIAYHVGSTMFDASTILFEEDGVDNFFLPETGLTGSFGANFQIIDTLSLGFLVRETGSDSCYIGDSDGGLTEVGSNCVDGLFDGNELLLLEEGSSIIRTNLVTFEPGGSEVPEPATWLLLSVGLGFAACRRASRR
jgi:hypothetical protein